MRTPLKEPAIRPMYCEDITEVLAIQRHVQGPAWTPDHFVNELRNGFCHAFVAHLGRQILGYVIFWIILDEAHLLNLAIHPSFRRSGVGRRLMAFLIHFSRRRGATWIALEVRKTNTPALALYSEFGFQQTRVRKSYYQDNHEDGIVMELELKREPT